MDRKYSSSKVLKSIFGKTEIQKIALSKSAPKIPEKNEDDQNLKFENLVHNVMSVNGHIEHMLKKLEDALDRLQKMYSFYLELAKKMNKVFPSNRGLNSAESSPSDNDKNPYKSLKFLIPLESNTHQIFEFTSKFKNEVLIYLSDEIKQIKSRRDGQVKKYSLEKGSLIKCRKSLLNIRRRGIEQIKNNYQKEFTKRMLEMGLKSKDLPGGHSFRKSMASVFTKKEPMSQSDLLRKHFKNAFSYNEKRMEYYRQTLPEILSNYAALFRNIRAVEKNLSQKIPSLFFDTLNQKLDLINMGKKIDVETEEHLACNFIRFNSPMDKEQFMEYSDKYIDKDSEILALKKQFNDIYDTRLEDLLLFDHNFGEAIPKEIYTVIEFIEKNGLSVEGIFRKSATKEDIDRFKMNIIGKKWNHFDENNVHAACCFVKHFLQQLPERIIQIEYQDSFINLGKKLIKNPGCGKDIILEFQELTNRFEKPTKTLLKYLLRFLKKVDENCKLNQMDAKNLSVVFSVILVPIEPVTKIDSKFKTGCFSDIIPFVQYLIENFNEIKW